MRIDGLTIKAVGRAEDGTLVPRTLPGEIVELTDRGEKIVSPSAHRVRPPCPHYKSCGACALQHASDGFVAGWKSSVVERALSAQGLRAEIAGIRTSPPGSRRRTKLSGRRSKSGALVGFHARASETVIDVPDCLVLRPALLAARPALLALARCGATRKSGIELTATESRGGIDVSVEEARPLDRPLEEALAALASEHGLARLTWNGETVALRSPPEHVFGAARVVPPPGSFLQATGEGETALVEQVLEATQGASRIVDLFAGCGTFTFPLATRSAVHAVDSVAPAIQALLKARRGLAGIRPVTGEVRDLFSRPLLKDELHDVDAVVVDPPRAGAPAQVAALCDADVPVIAMVSCNPVTFARDARVLVASGFGMGPITVVDQFRWSSHVELAARFQRG